MKKERQLTITPYFSAFRLPFKNFMQKNFAKN